MKVKLNTVEVNDFLRRAIWFYYMRTLPAQLATREQVKQWYAMHGESMDDDAVDEYDTARGAVE